MRIVSGCFSLRWSSARAGGTAGRAGQRAGRGSRGFYDEPAPLRGRGASPVLRQRSQGISYRFRLIHSAITRRSPGPGSGGQARLLRVQAAEGERVPINPAKIPAEHGVDQDQSKRPPARPGPDRRDDSPRSRGRPPAPQRREHEGDRAGPPRLSLGPWRVPAGRPLETRWHAAL
jgi:hypothetical protein